MQVIYSLCYASYNMTPASIAFRAGAPRSRSPNGVDQLRRVNIAFLPDERDLLAEIARLENRTASAAARHLMILGARAAYPELLEQFLQAEKGKDS